MNKNIAEQWRAGLGTINGNSVSSKAGKDQAQSAIAFSRVHHAFLLSAVMPLL